MVDILGFLHILWVFFWTHDQFFGILFLGLFWLKKIKKVEHRTIIQTGIYDKALELFIDWLVDLHSINQNPTIITEQDKEAERSKLMGANLIKAYKIFDKLSVCGSSRIKKWIKEKKKSSITNPPRPWVTDTIVEDFVYLISVDMGMVSIFDRLNIS